MFPCVFPKNGVSGNLKKKVHFCNKNVNVSHNSYVNPNAWQTNCSQTARIKYIGFNAAIFGQYQICEKYVLQMITNQYFSYFFLAWLSINFFSTSVRITEPILWYHKLDDSLN